MGNVKTFKKNDRNEKARELVAQMTLEEKAGLCSGKNLWFLKPVERLGLEPIMMTDGPHGLRKQVEDNIGIGDSVPAVCFPTASVLACSFDKELAFEIGTALGEECLQEGISVLLGPAANQKRSPLCGRNFEYFSEDPVLSGEMAAALINGVQSQGVGTSLKHFAVNNQEKRRMTVSAVVDERALRETYLKGYEIAVKKGKPWTVMCAYNKINDTYCSENSYLLTDILRNEWGFDGLVVSDWGAVNDRALGVKAGLDIEMPGCNGVNDVKIIAAVKNGSLIESDLDKVVVRVTELIMKSMESKRKDYKYNPEKHHRLSVRAAEESVVLLKNEDSILPGRKDKKTVIIGALAKEPRYQGAGSSKIHPIKIDNAWDALKTLGLEAQYSEGYFIKEIHSGQNMTDQQSKSKRQAEDILIQNACDKAKNQDVVYLFAGLLEGYESEGFDRTTLSLPDNQNRLIEAVTKVNPNVVVILSGGAPMELPWADKVKGILLSYLSGEGSGTAVARLLLGEAVPSGKLAETWPMKLTNTPAYHYFPGGRSTVEYRESIFVGYRYYEAAGKKVRYPFGHGLSYSSFTYSDLMTGKLDYNYGDEVTVTFDLLNSGLVTAKETALIYVANKNNKVFMPVKELKGFEKVELQPQESKRISVKLDTKDFAYYNTKIHDWYAGSGEYTILVGTDSSQGGLKAIVNLTSPDKEQPDLRTETPTYYHLSDHEFSITDKEFSALYGKELPPSNIPAERPYDMNSTLTDVEHTITGKLFISITNHMTRKLSKGDEEEHAMMSSVMKEMPFHSMITSGGGMISEKNMKGILDLLNGHYLKGIGKMLKRK